MNFRAYDSTTRAWLEAVEQNIGIDAELTLRYCNEIIELAMNKKDSALLGFAYFYLGQTYYCLNDSSNFLSCTSKAISYLAQVQDDIEAITPVRSAETKQLTLSFLPLWKKQNREASVSESTHRFLLCCIFPIRICVPFCPTAWKTQCMHVRISRMKKTE